MCKHRRTWEAAPADPQNLRRTQLSGIDEGADTPESSKSMPYHCCFRSDLLEDVPAAEAEEMRAAVTDALEAVAGGGWRLIGVGGGARGIASHDCDFVVTHPSNQCAPHMEAVPTKRLPGAWRHEPARCTVSRCRRTGVAEVCGSTGNPVTVPRNLTLSRQSPASQ